MASAVFVDVVGIGSGVCDRLAEQGIPVYPVNVGMKAHNESKFINLRSEVWWAAREAIDPRNLRPLALPNNSDLVAELAAPKFTVDSAGRIKVESKDEMKKRLGHSPDLADAFCLAVYGRFMSVLQAATLVELEEENTFVDTEGLEVGYFEM